MKKPKHRGADAQSVRAAGRRSKSAKILAIGALAVSVGSALYRFRRQWMPKAEEVGEAMRTKAAKFGRGAKVLRARYMPSTSTDGFAGVDQPARH